MGFWKAKRKKQTNDHKEKRNRSKHPQVTLRTGASAGPDRQAHGWANTVETIAQGACASREPGGPGQEPTDATFGATGKAHNPCRAQGPVARNACRRFRQS